MTKERKPVSYEYYLTRDLSKTIALQDNGLDELDGLIDDLKEYANEIENDTLFDKLVEISKLLQNIPSAEDDLDLINKRLDELESGYIDKDELLLLVIRE